VTQPRPLIGSIWLVHNAMRYYPARVLEHDGDRVQIVEVTPRIKNHMVKPTAMSAPLEAFNTDGGYIRLANWSH
jgi:hypothetical protein